MLPYCPVWFICRDRARSLSSFSEDSTGVKENAVSKTLGAVLLFLLGQLIAWLCGARCHSPRANTCPGDASAKTQDG